MSINILKTVHYIFSSLTVRQGALHPRGVWVAVSRVHQTNKEENRSRGSTNLGRLLTPTVPILIGNPDHLSVALIVCLRRQDCSRVWVKAKCPILHTVFAAVSAHVRSSTTVAIVVTPLSFESEEPYCQSGYAGFGLQTIESTSSTVYVMSSFTLNWNCNVRGASWRLPL